MSNLNNSHKKASEATHPSLSIVTPHSTLLTRAVLKTSEQSAYRYIKNVVQEYPEHYRIVQFNKPLKVRKKGLENFAEIMKQEERRYFLPQKTKNADKEKQNYYRSLQRTRRTLVELASCNHFDLFATLTFSSSKVTSRHDWQARKKDLTQWLNNQQKLHGKFNYIAVAEPHADGAIHFHLLLGGFTGKLISRGKKHKKSLKKSVEVYKIPAWERSFGFADAEAIGDSKRVSGYLINYIRKSITSGYIPKGGKRFWSNSGLKRPTMTYNRNASDFMVNGKLPTQTEYETPFYKILTIPKQKYEQVPKEEKKNRASW